jgi:hypothetical protein
MKTITGHMEWKEITTKRNRVLNVWTDFQKEDPSVQSWIESNKRLKLYKGWRKVCGCCHVSWEEINGNIVFVQTDKGNKIICENCWEGLS